MSKEFSMRHLIFKKLLPEVFIEETAPKWLTSEDTVKGSTMDKRWFWNDHVLKLRIGESINTDFRRITRIA